MQASIEAERNLRRVVSRYAETVIMPVYSPYTGNFLAAHMGVERSDVKTMITVSAG